MWSYFPRKAIVMLETPLDFFPIMIAVGPDFHQIAGSDLDGDGYFVCHPCFSSSLIQSWLFLQVYWGADFTCSEMVPPLSYDEHSESPNEQPITCETVIDFCYSLLGATNYGEIYNLHAVVVDRNIENHQKRTCQRLAIAMAKMFAVASKCKFSFYHHSIFIFSSLFRSRQR